MNFLNSTFLRNILGLVIISLIWLIFSVVGLKGVTFGKTIKEIRQEAGLSLLTLAIFTLGIFGLVAFFFSGQPSSPLPS